jgi:hypothetical protein
VQWTRRTQRPSRQERAKPVDTRPVVLARRVAVGELPVLVWIHIGAFYQGS